MTERQFFGVITLMYVVSVVALIFPMRKLLKIFPILEKILKNQVTLNERINKMADDLTTQLTAIEDQLSKASSEIVIKIEELERLLGTIPPEAQAKLDELKTTAQALDDIVPDEPPPPPVPA